ncbi:MAG: hypothetical protein QOF28_1036 [Actinomycetota bacterium]|jgi:hypothetical protein|nr:hypothetical protein [Actinomycetota bacterium]
MTSQAQTGGSTAQTGRRGHAEGRSRMETGMPEVEAA